MIVSPRVAPGWCWLNQQPPHPTCEESSTRGVERGAIVAVTGNSMASPDHGIPRSADFEVNVGKQAEEIIESENSIQNHETKETQASKDPPERSSASSAKDTPQSQAHVPQIEKKSNSKGDEAPAGSKSKKKKSKQAEEAQATGVATGLPCAQAGEDNDQTQAHVPQTEKPFNSNEAVNLGGDELKRNGNQTTDENQVTEEDTGLSCAQVEKDMIQSQPHVAQTGNKTEVEEAEANVGMTGSETNPNSQTQAQVPKVVVEDISKVTDETQKGNAGRLAQTASAKPGGKGKSPPIIPLVGSPASRRPKKKSR